MKTKQLQIVINYRPLFDKRKSNNTEIKFVVGLKEIDAVTSVDMLGITINDKLNFNLHNDKICPKALNQLNALIRFMH